MFMSDIVYLTKMTQAIARAYFKEFTIDPAVFLPGQPICQFQYSDEWVDAYLTRYKDCEHLATMLMEKPIGEILFKHMDHANKAAVLSIHLQNDSVKGKGHGTAAEKLAVKYGFDKMGLSVLYADTVKNNLRSKRVLEKVGFRLINEDNNFYYYEIRR